jgi:hypothetical protein
MSSMVYFFLNKRTNLKPTINTRKVMKQNVISNIGTALATAVLLGLFLAASQRPQVRWA